MSISLRESYYNEFGDKRLSRRAEQLAGILFESRTSSIHEMTSFEREQKGIYRFLGNEKVTEAQLIKVAKTKSQCLSAGKNVLVIQDTVEFKLHNHHNRLKKGKGSGVGILRKNDSLGFLMHSSMVLEEEHSMLLGFSDIQLWNREVENGNRHDRNYNSLPIEQKESNKWLKACRASISNMPEAQTITFIEDREGDIYEQFATIPDKRVHLIIRSKSNRNLGNGLKLFTYLNAQPLAGNHQIDVVKDIRKENSSRKASLEVRFCKVRLSKSTHRKRNELPSGVDVYAIEMQEVNYSGNDKIHWRILTTHAVTDYNEALSVVNKYKQRWHIEQLHRLLKQKGFRIESSELSSGWAIRKLTVLLLTTALRVMQLLLARDRKDSQALQEVFNEQEISCLKQVNDQLQGKVDEQKNNNPSDRLSWATWIIARLGGWKGVKDKRPPGPILLKKGMDKFLAIFQGWTMAQNLYKDVS